MIILLTFALPQVAQGALELAGEIWTGPGLNVSWGDSGVSAGATLGSVLGLPLQLLVFFVNAVGWGAGIWAVTQQAAGQPAAAVDALRVGLRRSGPMFGWYLLLLVMFGAGIVACIVPGLFLFVYGSLFSFVTVYERGRAGIGRSFGLVHRHSRVAGRALLLLLIFIGVNLGTTWLFAWSAGVTTLGPGEIGSWEVVAWLPWLAIVLNAAVTVPLIMVVLVGLLLTYTQVRGAEEQLTTEHLRAEASQ